VVASSYPLSSLSSINHITVDVPLAVWQKTSSHLTWQEDGVQQNRPIKEDMPTEFFQQSSPEYCQHYYYRLVGIP